VTFAEAQVCAVGCKGHDRPVALAGWVGLGNDRKEISRKRMRAQARPGVTFAEAQVCAVGCKGHDRPMSEGVRWVLKILV
jgi:hypothetical protein